MNRGAQALAAALGDERGAQQRLSEKLETSAGVVSCWLKGDRKPSARFRHLLEQLHGIPWPAWDEPAEAPTDSPTPSEDQVA